MTILLLQMEMSDKLKPAQLPADARRAVGYPGVGAGQLGHEDAVDGSGKKQNTEMIDRFAAPLFTSSATFLQSSPPGTVPYLAWASCS